MSENATPESCPLVELLELGPYPIGASRCPVVEALAVAYHEAGHAVCATLVNPPFPIESVGLLPWAWGGFTNYEDWHDNIIPDPYDDDHVGEISEHEQHILKCHDLVGCLGDLSEMRFRTGRLETSVEWYFGVDLDHILEHAELLMDQDLLRRLERDGKHWPPSSADPRAIRFVERHTYFWLAVGLVAGALMRKKSLDGFEVAQLLRVAEGRSRLTP